MKNMHGFEIIVNADSSDWGKHWGVASQDDTRCWCYACTVSRLTPIATDASPQGVKSDIDNDAAKHG